jgi:hypothetical protein
MLTPYSNYIVTHHTSFINGGTINSLPDVTSSVNVSMNHNGDAVTTIIHAIETASRGSPIVRSRVAVDVTYSSEEDECQYSDATIEDNETKAQSLNNVSPPPYCLTNGSVHDSPTMPQLIDSIDIPAEALPTIPQRPHLREVVCCCCYNKQSHTTLHTTQLPPHLVNYGSRSYQR